MKKILIIIGLVVLNHWIVEAHTLLAEEAVTQTKISEPQETSLPNPENNSETTQATIIEYVVQSGDTLSQLTAQYLGDASLWRLNAEINPEIPNVNFLKPGTTIRLITGYAEIEPEVEAYQALVEITSNEVNKSLQRGEWQNASGGDELEPKDGVRTKANSSAILVFDNTSRVQMTEYTQVFLRDRVIKDNGITRNEIEIEKGEAQLNIDTAKIQEGDNQNEFEIMLGGVRTAPRLNKEGQLSTKARLSDNETSQIMVYSGNSEVESAGVSVDVESGMGTVAKSGEAPSPPEKLLEAPILASNNPTKTSTDVSTPIKWNALETATSYTLVLCEDAECSRIFRTEKGLTATTRTLTDLPATMVYWRVSGVSASGLDGFTSKTQSISVTEPPPPLPELEPKGLPWYFWLLTVVYVLYFVKVFYQYAFK